MSKLRVMVISSSHHLQWSMLLLSSYLLIPTVPCCIGHIIKHFCTHKCCNKKKRQVHCGGWLRPDRRNSARRTHPQHLQAQDPQCTAWVYGLLGGVDTCFPAADVRGKVASADRSFCCMGKALSVRASSASSGSSTTATPQEACATLVLV